MTSADRPEDELFAGCYPELKRLARQRLADTERGATLDTTSLVHDIYVKLSAMGGIAAASRGQFMAYAARTMRSVIIDVVRSRAAEKHGGLAQMVTLDTDLGEQIAGEQRQLLDVDRAMLKLREVDERLVKVVEMRYFAGFSEAEVAATLAVTTRTVRRDWQRARLLLAAALDP